MDFDRDFRINLYRNKNRESGTAQTNQTDRTNPAEHDSDGGKPFNLSNEEVALLKILRDEPAITQKEAAKLLDWNISLVKYYISKLKHSNIIKRVGTIHNGHWEVRRR